MTIPPASFKTMIKDGTIKRADAMKVPYLVIRTVIADVQRIVAPQASEAVRKQALHQAADLVESFGRDAGAGHHFESSSYEAVVPAAANEISKLIHALADRPAPPTVKDGAGSKEHQ